VRRVFRKRRAHRGRRWGDLIEGAVDDRGPNGNRETQRQERPQREDDQPLARGEAATTGLPALPMPT
jgi:hypothetical protein